MELNTRQIVGGILGLMLLVVVVQALLPGRQPPPPEPAPPAAACVGEPIPVDYAFSGWLEPHACAVQCDDDKPRYVLYSDGKATQCEAPPGCNDEGEDNGVLCEPVLTSPTA